MPKTISDKYAESLDQIKTLETQNAELKAAADKVPGIEQQVADLQASVTELTETAEQAKTDHEAAITERDTKITALETSEKDLKAKLAMSPGHIITGGGDPVPDAQGNGGEGDDVRAQYDAIKDPAARTKFYREHKAEIINA